MAEKLKTKQESLAELSLKAEEDLRKFGQSEARNKELSDALAYNKQQQQIADVSARIAREILAVQQLALEAAKAHVEQIKNAE